MSPAVSPCPATETVRVAAVHSGALLDSLPEPHYDAIAMLAAQLLDMPHAYIAMLEHDRLWYKARHNLPLDEVPRGLSFCTHAIVGDTDIIVDDMTRDPRFCDDPYVTADDGVRFYAGMPIRVTAEDGRTVPIGTLCVLDHKPRTLTHEQRQAMRHLADLAEALVEARATAQHAARVAARAEAQSADLARQDRIFREAERMALIGSWRLSLVDDVVTWSDGIYRIHHLPIGEQPELGRALDFYPVHARARVNAALAHTIATGDAFDFEEDFVTASGEQRRVRSRGEREMVDGVAVAICGVFQDVTDHHLLAMQLRRSADVDELTGIANRAAFNRTVAAAIATALADRSPLMLVLIDLDGFKQINDTLGHLAGDDVLRAVGRRLRGSWLRGSFAARVGGDEFALIVDDPTLARDPVDFAERLQREMCHPVVVGGVTITASGTVGTALLGSADNVRDFVHAADTDLYAAKRKRHGNRRREDRQHAA